MERTPKEVIQQRRRQMILHSFIYYRMGESIIDDYQFDTWARELLALQTKYPSDSFETPYYEHFKDWDATTGYHLPFHEYEWVERMAYAMLEYHQKFTEEV